MSRGGIAGAPRGFFEALEARAREIDSLLCVGLDPHSSDLGGGGGADADAAAAFCTRLIDATAGVAAAYKPNAAFFEAFGEEGARALRRVVAHVPPGVPVLLDVKRGDIASTAEAYGPRVQRGRVCARICVAWTN